MVDFTTRAETYLTSAEAWLEQHKTHQEPTPERAGVDALVAIGYGLLAIADGLQRLVEQQSLTLNVSEAEERHGRHQHSDDGGQRRAATHPD